MLRRLRPYLEGLGGEPTVIICGASALLVIGRYQGSTAWFRGATGAHFDGHPASGVLGYFWWFGASLVLYLLAPLLIAKLTRGSFHQRYGLGLGDWRAGLGLGAVFLAVMVPAVLLAAHWDAFKGVYPLAGARAYTLGQGDAAVVSLGLFALYEAAYFLYFVGWEFLFRGWMVHGLLPTWGRGPAILVQVAPFVVMHLGKAEPEALGSIVAGIALAILSLRTRSFWYGAGLHGTIAVLMDVVSAWPALRAP